VRALTLLFGVALATDVIAGEVGRGTADLLFAHPVRRRAAVLAGAIVVGMQLLCVGAVILLAFAAGTALFPMGEHQPTIGQLIPSVADVVLTSFAIILVAFLVGSLCATRARAVGWSLFIILGSIVLDFMSVFTKVFSPLVRVLPEHYYRPHTILFGLQDPTLLECTVALTLIGAAALGGAIWFAERRDLTR
jgi:ABC-type transport system involved in multi-copper enzyme maturation permease subunit